MPRRLLLIAALVAFTAAGDAAAATRTIVITGKGDAARITRVGALKRRDGAMRLGAARAAFGRPSSSARMGADDGSNGDPARCVVRWSRLGLEGVFFTTRPVRGRPLCDRRQPLRYLTISKDTFATERGMRVGTGYATVRRLYPSIPDHGDDHYDLFGAHLQFDVANGRVTSLDLYL